VSDPGVHARAHAEELTRLLADLVAIPSVTGDELALAEFCAGWLTEHGVEARLQPVDGRANVIGVAGVGPDALVLSGHLDTVPPERAGWTRDPFEPLLEEGRLVGLGASDLKASLAACLMAQRFVAQRAAAGERVGGRLVTAFTVEEETTGRGTRAFLDEALESGLLDPARTVAVITEPSNLVDVGLGNKGTCFAVVRLVGRGGHGSRPAEADSPIDGVRALLEGLPALHGALAARHAHARLGVPSITPTVVRAGDVARRNAIPDEAELVLDCRVTPGLWADGFRELSAHLDVYLEECLPEGVEGSAELTLARPGQLLDEAHPLALLALATLRDEMGLERAAFHWAPSGNDACFFAERGIDALNKVGPGLPSQAHRGDEYADVELAVRAVEFYARLALSWFAAR
jgi:acetylornithine deacetylase/succinyl-diaminopimelate desuccinylase-like protein